MDRVRKFLRGARRLLLWVSMTEGPVLDRADERSAMMQATMGALVLLVGTFALFSGGYALYVTFGSVYLAALLAVPYALFIALLDRLVVGATSRWTAFPRVVLAFSIGLAVAVPLELKFFNGAIENHLQKETLTYNQALRDSLQSGVGLASVSSRIKTLQSERREAIETARQASRKAACEAGGLDRPGCTGEKGEGPVYRAAQQRKERAQLRAKSLKRKVDSLAERRAKLQERVQRRFEALKREAEGGLLARYQALGQIKKESPAARKIAWGLVLFFVLLEMSPALLKTLRRKTVYEKLLLWREEALATVEKSDLNAEANRDVQSAKKKDPTVQAGGGSPNQRGQGLRPPPSAKPRQGGGASSKNGQPSGQGGNLPI